jgi:hypothetical protein
MCATSARLKGSWIEDSIRRAACVADTKGGPVPRQATWRERKMNSYRETGGL